MELRHVIYVESEVEGADGETVALIQAAVQAALAAEGVAVPCEVDVLLTDDAGIHAINLEQREIDRPTDVLSFPMLELTPGVPLTGENADPEPDTGLTALGDMVISLERVRAQAAEYGHPERRELCYLVVHSVLHLLGYDHLDNGPQQLQMRTREEAVLGAMGITRGA